MWCLHLRVMLLAVVIGTVAGLFSSGVAQTLVTLEPEEHTRSNVIDHHSFSPPFLSNYFGDGDLPYWKMEGSTVVTDDYVRLTPDEQNRHGGFWNEESLDLDEFEILFGLHFHSAGTNYGQRFMLSITTNPSHSDDALANKLMSLNGMMLVFDMTGSSNWQRKPTISLIHNQGRKVDKSGGQHSDDIAADVSCTLSRSAFTKNDNYMRVRVHYQQNVLSVTTSSRGGGSTHCLHTNKVVLDTRTNKYYIGLEAQTSSLTEAHDILFFHVLPLGDELEKMNKIPVFKRTSPRHLRDYDGETDIVDYNFSLPEWNEYVENNLGSNTSEGTPLPKSAVRGGKHRTRTGGRATGHVDDDTVFDEHIHDDTATNAAIQHGHDRNDHRGDHVNQKQDHATEDKMDADGAKMNDAQKLRMLEAQLNELKKRLSDSVHQGQK